MSAHQQQHQYGYESDDEITHEEKKACKPWMIAGLAVLAVGGLTAAIAIPVSMSGCCSDKKSTTTDGDDKSNESLDNKKQKVTSDKLSTVSTADTTVKQLPQLVKNDETQTGRTTRSEDNAAYYNKRDRRFLRPSRQYNSADKLLWLNKQKVVLDQKKMVAGPAVPLRRLQDIKSDFLNIIQEKYSRVLSYAGANHVESKDGFKSFKVEDDGKYGRLTSVDSNARALDNAKNTIFLSEKHSEGEWAKRKQVFTEDLKKTNNVHDAIKLLRLFATADGPVSRPKFV